MRGCRLQSVTPRPLLVVVATWAAEDLGGYHLGRRVAGGAFQPGARSGAAEPGRAAGRTERRQTLCKALGKHHKALHPGRIEMGAHVGLQACPTIR